MNTQTVDEAARSVVDANRYMTLGTADGASAEVRLYRAAVSECFLGRSDEHQGVSAEYLDR